MNEPVMVKCRCCGGSGEIELAGVYEETLELLRSHPGLNGSSLARLAGCTGEAMANRLVALESKGLAVGRRRGRERTWVGTTKEVAV